MKLLRRRFLHLAVGAAALPPSMRIARAQAYPTRPITVIVPFAAGGPSDTLARILAGGMRQQLGQPVIIENATGGDGSIGVGRAVRAAADGYTLSFGSISSHVLNGALYPLGYDLLKDLAPVALLGSVPLVVVGRKAIPGDDLRGLITWLKTNPDKASAGTAGVGNITHVAGILFQERTATRFQFVPYRGTAPAMQDLVAGLIDLMVASPIDFLPHLRSGSIRAYAVMGSSRLAVAPDIPTADEAGLAGLYASAWYALWAPKSAPSVAIAKLNVAIVESLADVQLRARLAQLGFDVFAREQQTPEALATLQKAEIEKWWPIIKAAGIKAE
jgi:tripartite-type tricarboxylate transporter receptor subunit TctC